LTVAGSDIVDRFVAQVYVREGFQQAAGEVLQATEQLFGRPSKLGRHIAQQAADLEDLQNDVSELQQEIVDFEPFRVGAENMLQVQAVVLLMIESLAWIPTEGKGTNKMPNTYKWIWIVLRVSF